MHTPPTMLREKYLHHKFNTARVVREAGVFRITYYNGTETAGKHGYYAPQSIPRFAHASDVVDMLKRINVEGVYMGYADTPTPIADVTIEEVSQLITASPLGGV